MTDSVTYGPAELDFPDLFMLPGDDPREVPASLAAIWDEVAAHNPWIKRAADPVFFGSKVRICRSRYELRCWLEFGNWCNGAAFAVEEGGQVLCFMQQGECTDEWLVVKAVPATFRGRPAYLYVDFESISWHYILTRRPEKFASMLDDMFAATLDECRSYSYGGAAARVAAGQG